MPKVSPLTDEQRADRKCSAFGDWVDGEIRRRRKSGQNMSRMVVSEWLGISPQALCKLINGQTEWKLKYMMIICKKFKTDNYQIWELTNLEDK